MNGTSEANILSKPVRSIYSNGALTDMLMGREMVNNSLSGAASCRPSGSLQSPYVLVQPCRWREDAFFLSSSCPFYHFFLSLCLLMDLFLHLPSSLCAHAFLSPYPPRLLIFSFFFMGETFPFCPCHWSILMLVPFFFVNSCIRVFIFLYFFYLSRCLVWWWWR